VSVCVCVIVCHFFDPTDLNSCVNAGSTGTMRERQWQRKRKRARARQSDRERERERERDYETNLCMLNPEALCITHEKEPAEIYGSV